MEYEKCNWSEPDYCGGLLFDNGEDLLECTHCGPAQINDQVPYELSELGKKNKEEALLRLLLNKSKILYDLYCIYEDGFNEGRLNEYGVIKDTAKALDDWAETVAKFYSVDC